MYHHNNRYFSVFSLSLILLSRRLLTFTQAFSLSAFLRIFFIFLLDSPLVTLSLSFVLSARTFRFSRTHAIVTRSFSLQLSFRTFSLSLSFSLSIYIIYFISVCVYIYIYTHIHIHTYTCMCVYIYIYTSIYLSYILYVAFYVYFIYNNVMFI